MLKVDCNLTVMEYSDVQKSVGLFFSMMQTLTYWAKYVNGKRKSREDETFFLPQWPVKKGRNLICEFIAKMPLVDQATVKAEYCLGDWNKLSNSVGEIQSQKINLSQDSIHCQPIFCITYCDKEKNNKFFLHCKESCNAKLI